jgi:hypothetical protein
MRRRLTIALVVGASIAGWGAPAAYADDASLFAAYDGHQAGALKTAYQAYEHWARRWDRSHGDARSARGMIPADHALNAALAHIGDDLTAEQPSSANGKKAKRYALAEIAAWQTANRYEVRGLGYWLRGHRARARAWFDRAGRTMVGRTYPDGRRAVRAFAAAGLKSPNRALWQTP